MQTLYILGYPDNPYIDILKALNLLPLSYERGKTDIITFYKIIYGFFNVDIYRYFFINNNLGRGRNNNLAFNIILMRYRCDNDRQFYKNRVILLWNPLPLAIKNIKPNFNREFTCKLSHFKRTLNGYLYNCLCIVFHSHNICTWSLKRMGYNCRSEKVIESC